MFVFNCLICDDGVPEVVHDFDCVAHDCGHVVQRILSRVKLHR